MYGDYIFSICMPFVEKKEVSLNQKADELIIKVGSIKRRVTLPRTLLNYSVKSAKFENEILKIRFGLILPDKFAALICIMLFGNKSFTLRVLYVKILQCNN